MHRFGEAIHGHGASSESKDDVEDMKGPSLVFLSALTEAASERAKVPRPFKSDAAL